MVKKNKKNRVCMPKIFPREILFNYMSIIINFVNMSQFSAKKEKEKKEVNMG